MLRRYGSLHFLLAALSAVLIMFFVIEPLFADQHSAQSGPSATAPASVVGSADGNTPTSGDFPAGQAIHMCHCLHQHVACGSDKCAAPFVCETIDTPMTPTDLTTPAGVRPQLLRPPIA